MHVPDQERVVLEVGLPLLHQLDRLFDERPEVIGFTVVPGLDNLGLPGSPFGRHSHTDADAQHCRGSEATPEAGIAGVLQREKVDVHDDHEADRDLDRGSVPAREVDLRKDVQVPDVLGHRPSCQLPRSDRRQANVLDVVTHKPSSWHEIDSI